jgi:hypothetical protein
MYDMQWKITIGNYRLAMMESVEVKHSVELLADTATIVLPATAYNKALDVESKIKRGDKVSIELGYDGDLYNEFSGFVESITTDGGSLKINCEDAIFLYRVDLKDIELKEVDVNTILKHVNTEVSKYYPNETAFTLSCNYSFKYDKFVIRGNTGHDVLKTIQEETKTNVYLKDRVLHAHLQYTEIFGKVSYDFSKNIETPELKYKLASDRKFMVVVEYTDSEGKTKSKQYGTIGGDKLTVNKKGLGISDPSSLEMVAKEELNRKVYTGYEGSFTGWLIPYCDAGYRATIKDKDYEFKTGSYYVTGTEVKFSMSGGARVITLGKRLNDE